MTLPVNPHNPVMAGGIETVTGSLEINTGLRELQSASVTFISTPSANATFLAWGQREAGGVILLTIYVRKSDYAASITATQVSWIALGK